MASDTRRYEQDYMANLGFEAVLVAYRRDVVLERLRALGPSVVLEIGCGPDLLYRHFLSGSAAVEQWIVVEPVAAWCEDARRSGLPALVAIEGFFEERLDEVLGALKRPPDVVVCSGVLPEARSAPQLLAAIRRAMGPETVLHINAPNVRSFHRRLAVAMGLIPSVDTFSDRNVLLQQQRLYDAQRLEADLRDGGFDVLHRGGHFMKPFTNEQMAAVQQVLGPHVLDGLFRLGREYPELAAEIYCEARLSR